MAMSRTMKILILLWWWWHQLNLESDLKNLQDILSIFITEMGRYIVLDIQSLLDFQPLKTSWNSDPQNRCNCFHILLWLYREGSPNSVFHLYLFVRKILATMSDCPYYFHAYLRPAFLILHLMSTHNVNPAFFLGYEARLTAQTCASSSLKLWLWLPAKLLVYNVPWMCFPMTWNSTRMLTMSSFLLSCTKTEHHLNCQVAQKGYKLLSKYTSKFSVVLFIRFS